MRWRLPIQLAEPRGKKKAKQYKHTLLRGGISDTTTVTSVTVILELARNSNVVGDQAGHHIVAEVHRSGLPAGPAVI
jgi:hypothetical protein